MSSKVRSRRYRESLKLPGNEEKLEHYKELSRKFQSKYRKQMIEIHGEVFKLKRSQQAQASRDRKAASMNPVPEAIGYKNSRQLSYAVTQILRKLPKDPLKKRQISQELIERLTRSLDQEVLNVVKDEVLSEDDAPEEEEEKGPSEKTKSILDFYNREDISKRMPDKHLKSVKTLTGKKKFQVKYMTKTLGEAYEAYKSENPGLKVGLSTFCNLRPAYVYTSAKLAQKKGTARKKKLEKVINSVVES